MKEKPILFTAPMVRAILDGRKTQTRRMVKPQPPDGHSFAGFTMSSTCTADEGKATWGAGDTSVFLNNAHRVRCPYGQPGDRLWVRETWAPVEPKFDKSPAREIRGVRLLYRADDVAGYIQNCWRPSIFMPRWASRITLELTGVRVERLQDITRNDAMAEGVFLNENDYWTAGEMEPGKVLAGLDCPQHAYGRLWEYINGPGSWLLNPWVWVLEFKRI